MAWLCEALRALVQPDSQWFNWRFGSKIHYIQKGRTGPRVLLVHGFGVGSFQFIPLMDQLAEDHQVWALDLLGQGLSWPSAEALTGAQSHASHSFRIIPCYLSRLSCFASCSLMRC